MPIELPGNDERNDLESDPFSPGTADDVSDAEELLGEGNEQSDLDLADSDSPDDGSDSVESDRSFLTDAERALLMQDPNAGVSAVENRIAEFVRKQNKKFTNRMKKIAAQRKEAEEIRQKWNVLDNRFAAIQQKYPGEFERIKRLLMDPDSVGSATTPKQKPPSTVPELMNSIRKMIHEEVGGLRGEYIQDRSSKEIDDFLKRAKNEKLTAIRDKLVAIKAEHPDYSIKQILGSADPDLLLELVNSARAAKSPPVSGERTTHEFSLPRKRKFSSIDECLDDAIAQHGGLAP